MVAYIFNPSTLKFEEGGSLCILYHPGQNREFWDIQKYIIGRECLKQNKTKHFKDKGMAWLDQEIGTSNSKNTYVLAHG